MSKLAFTEQQNAVRGAIAQYKSRAFRANSSADDHLRALRHNLAGCQLLARSVLDTAQYASYVTWVADQVASLVPEHRNNPVAFDNLAGLQTDMPRVGIERELKWITARVLVEGQTIRKFRQAAEKLDALLISGRLRAASRILDTLNDSFGHTLWSIQTQFALLHRIGGLEKQKAYLDGLRRQYKRGILSFVAFYTSMRNEDRTTLARYKEDIRARISSHRYYKSETRNYLKYRLAGEWPTSHEAICDILRLEQSHSILDIYETLIAFVQEVIRREDLGELRPLVLSVLREIEPIADFRIYRAQIGLGEGHAVSALHAGSSDIADLVIEGELTSAVSAFKRARLNTQLDVWPLLYVAGAYSQGHMRPPHVRDSRRSLIRAAAQAFAPGDDRAVSLAQLEKVAQNFSGLPIGAALGDLAREIRAGVEGRTPRFELVSINSRVLGPEDNFYAISKPADDAARPSERFWQAMRCAVPPQLNGIEPRVAAYARAFCLLRADGAKKSIELIEPFTSPSYRGPLRELSVTLLAIAQSAGGDVAGLIRTTADEGARNAGARALLPIKDALSSLSWNDLKNMKDEISVPIALDLLWRVTDSEKTASLLRFAVGEFLKGHSISKPSELSNLSDAFVRHQLIYFLSRIAIPSVIDVSRSFKSSRAVLEERLAICQYLLTIDSENYLGYQAEANDISERLLVEEGMRIVARSRVHVDSQAITRWAARELAELFARYKDLVRAGIGVSENLDEVIRSLSTSGQAFSTPDSESDHLLIEICAKLIDEFLNNPDYGLDYFLSKRIRHQSFIGLVRGPLEFGKLITTRETETGPYRPNQYWLDQLCSLGPAESERLVASFNKFSADFDDLLVSAKDKRFQIKSNEKPLGIFDIPLSPEVLALSRAVAQVSESLDFFCTNIYSLFWGVLEYSLREARRFITEDLKNSVASLFDRLRGELRLIAETDLAFPELISAVSNVATEVQRSLDEAAGWFTRAETQFAIHKFSLEQAIDIALRSVMKSNRGFDMNLEKSVAGEIELSASSLVALTDIFSVALGNVKTHSGLRAPRVIITCSVDREGRALEIEVLSSTHERARTKEREARLTELRQLIAQRKLSPRAKREGGSGFAKLAAMTQHTPGGDLQFGFVGDGDFRLFARFGLVGGGTAAPECSGLA